MGYFSIEFKNFPRKAKKKIKRNFMKTIGGNWTEKDVTIKWLRRAEYGERPDYKSWVVYRYHLGVIS